MKRQKKWSFALCFGFVSVGAWFALGKGRGSSGPDSARQGPAAFSVLAYAENGDTNDAAGRSCRDVSNVTESWNGSWQSVSGSNMSMYSAFYDDRLKPRNVVRILGMSAGDEGRLFCRVWWSETRSAAAPATSREIWVSGWDAPGDLPYQRPFLLTCALPDSTAAPVAVSVTSAPCGAPSNRFRLLPPPPRSGRKDFVVCLKPLRFERDVVDRLVEWTELQLLLGADRVAAYVSRVPPATAAALRHYERRSAASVKRWRPPPGAAVSNDTWQKRRHEIVPYNDCFYRHLHTHRHVVMLDLDEAIVPLRHDTWAALLRHVFARRPDAAAYASLSVTNVYFFDTFGETDDPSIPADMHMLRHVRRAARFSPPGFAVKSFFSTDRALAVFNHYALWTLGRSARAVAPLDRSLARLHHYRAGCPPLMERACRDDLMKFTVTDTIVWKFKEKWIENVRSAKRDIASRRKSSRGSDRADDAMASAPLERANETALKKKERRATEDSFRGKGPFF